VAISLTEPSIPPQVVVPEHKADVLVRAQRVGRFLALQYLTPSLTSELRFVDLEDSSYSVVSPWSPPDHEIPGTLSALTGDERSGKAYFTYESIAQPRQTFVVDLAHRPDVTPLPAGPVPFDGSRVKHTLRTYPSTDKQTIPIQIIVPSDVKQPAFIYLYYYGAIGIPTLPGWNITFQLVLELGGAVAIANVRGGGERGAEWQLSAKRNRALTLQDISAAAAWLKSQYPGLQIVSSGRSYGGMHTLASMIISPDAFNLFVAEMPVTDVVEFLENGAFGRSAWDDFGFTHNPAGDLRSTTSQVDALKGWSPAARVGDLVAPIAPVLLITSETDDRVEPEQSRQMALALARRGMAEQVYLREEPTGGHTAPTSAAVATFIASNFVITELQHME
jgi:prolyl oligopeptidase